MSTESLHSGQNLKAALFALPKGMPVTTGQMEERGISRQLVHKYVKSGWLEPLGNGYYRRPGDEITRNGAIAALNLQGAQLHIGGTGADADIVAVVTAVHHTLGQVGALLLFHLHDLANDHLADACIQRDQLFHLKAAGEQLLLQLLSGNVDINEFF